MGFTQEEMEKLKKSMKQNLQVSVDYITNYAKKYTAQAKEKKDTEITMLLMHAIVLIEAYMELAKKYVVPKKTKAEMERILKLLHESDWLENEGDFYLLEFDAEDRELTQKALSELIQFTAEPEEFDGEQTGFALVDGYTIDEENHCTLYIKSCQPEKCAMQSLLKYMFEGKKK